MASLRHGKTTVLHPSIVDRGLVTGPRTHQPALDGLRAVAVLAVIVSHAWPVVLRGGWVGVDIFFVLSGYLITSILLDEHARNGEISLRRFYARRALRLLPALGAAIVLAVALSLPDPALARATGDQAAATIAYIANWRDASGASPGLLGHTWSLSVEEQFYLAWPLLLLVLLRVGGRRAALVGVLAGCVAVLIHRAGVPEPLAYFRTDTRGDSLLLGCAVALAAAEGAFARVPHAMVTACATVGALFLGFIAVAAGSGGAPTAATTYTLIGLAAAAVLVAVAVRPLRWSRALQARPLVWVGQRSYGVYLYHPMAMYILSARFGLGPVTLAGVLLLTLSLAGASYRFLERPFLRLKARVTSAPASAAVPAAAAGSCVELVGRS